MASSALGFDLKAQTQTTPIKYSFDEKSIEENFQKNKVAFDFAVLRELPKFKFFMHLFPKDKIYTPAEIILRLNKIQELQDQLIQEADLKKREALKYFYELLQQQLMQAFLISLGGVPKPEEEDPKPTMWTRFQCWILSKCSLAAEGTDGFLGTYKFVASLTKFAGALLVIPAIIGFVGFLIKTYCYKIVEIAGLEEEMGCSEKAIFPFATIHSRQLELMGAANSKLTMALASPERSLLDKFSITRLAEKFSAIMKQKNQMNAYVEPPSIKRKRTAVGILGAVVDGLFGYAVVAEAMILIGLMLSWSPPGWVLLLIGIPIAGITAYCEYKSSMPLGFHQYFNPEAEVCDDLKESVTKFKNESNNDNAEKIKIVITQLIAEIKACRTQIIAMQKTTFNLTTAQDKRKTIDDLIKKVQVAEDSFGAIVKIKIAKMELKTLIKLFDDTCGNNIQSEVQTLNAAKNDVSKRIFLNSKRAREQLLDNWEYKEYDRFLTEDEKETHNNKKIHLQDQLRTVKQDRIAYRFLSSLSMLNPFRCCTRRQQQPLLDDIELKHHI